MLAHRPTAATAPARGEALLWLALLALHRGLLVACLGPVFFYGEELEKGAAAKALADGLAVPWHTLAYHYFEGGGFAISHLQALLFLALGETLLTQKLAALLLTLLLQAALWRLADHHLGRRAARGASLAFLLGPTFLQRGSLLSLGYHLEAMVFGLLVLDEGLRLLGGEPARGRTWRRLRLGLLAGLGICFNLQLVLVVGWVGLLLLVRRPGALVGRAGLAGWAGLALGLAPMAYLASQVGSEVLRVHGQPLTGIGADGQRLRGFLASVYGSPEPWTRGPAWLYTLLAGVSLAGAAWMARRGHPSRRAVLALLGFVGAWTLAWASGAFVWTQYRYWVQWLRFAPAFVALLLAGAAVWAAAHERGGWSRGLARVGAGLFLAYGLSVSLRTAMAGQPTTLAANVRLLRETRLVAYEGYFSKLLIHLRGGSGAELEPGQVAPLLGYDEPVPERVWTALAWVWSRGWGPQVTVHAALERLGTIGPADRRAVLLGLGDRAMLEVGCRFRPLASLQRIEHFAPELRPALAEAMGYMRHIPPGCDSLADHYAHLAQAASGPQRAAYLRGLGGAMYRDMVMGSYHEPFLLKGGRARQWIQRALPRASGHLLMGFAAERRRWRPAGV